MIQHIRDNLYNYATTGHRNEYVKIKIISAIKLIEGVNMRRRHAIVEELDQMLCISDALVEKIFNTLKY